MQTLKNFICTAVKNICHASLQPFNKGHFRDMVLLKCHSFEKVCLVGQLVQLFKHIFSKFVEEATIVATTLKGSLFESLAT